ncbi:MAG: hypothetical protein ACOZF2_14580 [Thermodesulfobacteriota bacterium]
MFWTLLPFMVVVILVLGLLLTSGALVPKLGVPSPKGAGLVEKTEEQCRYQEKRYAIVDNEAPIRFLSREEVESIKKFNPTFIEMKAGDIVYLTEPPSGPIPPLAAPRGIND